MKSILIMLVVAFAMGGNQSCERKNDCPEDIICSMVFKSIAVDVVDGAGEKIVLTSATVSSAAFDHTINSIEESPEGGPYTIVNDSHMKWLSQHTPYDVEFSGWIADSLVVSQSYKIRHDCCHVVLVEGPEVITLE